MGLQILEGKIMTEENSKHEKQLQFFFEEQKISVEIYFKYSEYIWNDFKFFITFITGVGGVIIALISFGQCNITDSNNIILVASLTIIFIGIIGLSKLVQLENDQNTVAKRIKKAREKISNLTSLGDYFEDLKNDHAELCAPCAPIDFKYPRNFLSWFKGSRFKGFGVKSTLILINSTVGVFIIFYVAELFGEITTLLCIPVYIFSFIVFIIIHYYLIKYFDDLKKK